MRHSASLALDTPYSVIQISQHCFWSRFHCLMALSHCLNQHWLIFNDLIKHLPEGSFIGNAQYISSWTHWGRMTHICVGNIIIIRYWFRWWLVAWSAPSHYLNRCLNIVNWTLRNKLQWKLKRNSYIFFQDNAFENIVCETAGILSRPQCVKHVCETAGILSRPQCVKHSKLQRLRLRLRLRLQIQVSGASALN